MSLNEKERIVFNVVQDYLDRNRQFNMKKILLFINSRFKMAKVNINLAGIEGILKSLERKNFIVEGSKLRSTELLSVPKRKLIYNYIMNKPGVYFNKIVKDLRLSNHIVVWHLEMLVKFNFIKEMKFDNHDIYFNPNLDFNAVRISYYFSKSKVRNILDYLKKNKKGITKTQLSKDLHIHHNTITKYLDILENLTVVLTEPLSRKTLYYINENFREEMVEVERSFK